MMGRALTRCAVLPVVRERTETKIRGSMRSFRFAADLDICCGVVDLEGIGERIVRIATTTLDAVDVLPVSPFRCDGIPRYGSVSLGSAASNFQDGYRLHLMNECARRAVRGDAGRQQTDGSEESISLEMTTMSTQLVTPTIRESERCTS